jgi:dTDP-glucose 4,6-dehydratase
MILVTGAGGFIGSHLVEHLLDKGHDVRAMVHYNSMDSIGWLTDISESKAANLDIVYGDLTDFDLMEKITKGVKSIINLGALIPIPYSYEAPRSYVGVNIVGVMNLLEILRRHGGRLVQISTSEVFGSAKFIPINESHPRNAQSPYAATKVAADEFLKSYVASFGLNATIARPFNTFGPRQSTRAVIPTIIAQALKSKVVELGDVTTTRDFNYVLDTITGIEAVMNFGLPGEDYNIGSGIERNILEIVKSVEVVLRKELKISIDQNRIRPEKSEVRKLICDSSKLKLIANWESEHTKPENFGRTIEKLVTWYTQNLPKRDFRL